MCPNKKENLLDFRIAQCVSIPYEVIQLEKEVHTASETARVLGCSISMILKSMLVYDARNPQASTVVIIPGDKRLDLEKVKRLCNYVDPRLVPASQVHKRTGFAVGTLPPWGYSGDIATYYDSSIKKNDFVYGGSGNPK